jgi:hypothetical protein
MKKIFLSLPFAGDLSFQETSLFRRSRGFSRKEQEALLHGFRFTSFKSSCLSFGIPLQ